MSSAGQPNPKITLKKLLVGTDAPLKDAEFELFEVDVNGNLANDAFKTFISGEKGFDSLLITQQINLQSQVFHWPKVNISCAKLQDFRDIFHRKQTGRLQ